MPYNHGTRPKPFQRPSIPVKPVEAKKRTWQHVPAENLASGDTVADRGQISLVNRDLSTTPRRITFRFLSGKQESFDKCTEVYAFTEAQGG